MAPFFVDEVCDSLVGAAERRLPWRGTWWRLQTGPHLIEALIP